MENEKYLSFNVACIIWRYILVSSALVETTERCFSRPKELRFSSLNAEQWKTCGVGLTTESISDEVDREREREGDRERKCAYDSVAIWVIGLTVHLR